MDLHLTESQKKFRHEVRAFIDERVPPALRRKMRLGHTPNRQETVEWHRTLNERGWAAPHWPKRYGGADLGTVERILLQEELYRAPAPQPLAFNVTMLGPVLLKFGSEEQLAYWMPKLANVDILFSQGFSEPGAGSDLASLRTAAVREGDDYVVNGQKIWTTKAHWADWIFCLVRTSREARKQDGISMLLIDLKTPGITVRPIHSIDHQHHLNEVFFDNVRVPVGNLVGDEGRGWDCTKLLLSNERIMLGAVGHSRERLGRARELLAEAPIAAAAKRRAAEDIAVLEAEVRALEMIQWRMVALDAADSRAAVLASVLKLKGSELTQAIAALLLRLAGPAGIEVMTDAGGERGSHPASAAAPQYFYYRASTLYGGSTEIQRELISRELFR